MRNLWILGILGFLANTGYASGGTANLTVSSGTYQAISLYANDDGGSRQAVILGDRVSSATVTIDAVTGMRVSLSTSALTTSNGIKIEPGQFAIPVVSTGSMAVTQSGIWTVANSTIGVIFPSAQAVTATQSGIWSVANSTIGIVFASAQSVNATQTGTWTVQPGNTANTTAWKVDGSAVTQPVSLSGNQAVNVAQINGVTPLMGNGATGTGSHRVTISNDNTGIGNWGQGATGSAVPSGASYQAGIAKTSLPSAASDGNLVGSLRDKYGRTLTIADCPRDLILSTGAILTANTAEYVLLSSGAAGVFNDSVAMVITNSSATGSLLTFRTNGNGTTSTLHFYVPASDTRGFSLAHIWPQGTAASNWTVQSSASVSSIYVDMTYCQDK